MLIHKNSKNMNVSNNKIIHQIMEIKICVVMISPIRVYLITIKKIVRIMIVKLIK